MVVKKKAAPRKKPAPRKKKVAKKDEVSEDFTKDLIASLNKEFGSKVAYNLGTEISPTHVKRWIPTGSRQLDYMVAVVVFQKAGSSKSSAHLQLVSHTSRRRLQGQLRKWVGLQYTSTLRTQPLSRTWQCWALTFQSDSFTLTSIALKTS